MKVPEVGAAIVSTITAQRGELHSLHYYSDNSVGWLASFMGGVPVAVGFNFLLLADDPDPDIDPVRNYALYAKSLEQRIEALEDVDEYAHHGEDA